MHERDFLHEVCISALSVSKKVSFAGIVDSNGKLLLGHEKKNADTNRRRLLCYIGNYENKVVVNIYFKHLAPMLNEIIKRNFFDRKSNTLIYDSDTTRGEDAIRIYEINEFYILDVASNIKLGFIPITETANKFLCVYLESDMVEMSNTSYRRIVASINRSL
ncbi:MAG: hypothetical protein WBX01_05205 [Nitrososphaeraceae archaeon]|jgi:hypothetical protein